MCPTLRTEFFCLSIYRPDLTPDSVDGDLASERQWFEKERGSVGCRWTHVNKREQVEKN